MKDIVRATGVVSFYINGVLEAHENLVLSLGKRWIAERSAGVAAAPITHIGVGTGSTPAAAGQLGLVTEVARQPLTAPTSVLPDSATLRAEAVFPAGVGNGPLVEAGLFTNAVAGVCVARTVFGVKNKDPDDVFTIVWGITIS